MIKRNRLETEIYFCKSRKTLDCLAYNDFFFWKICHEFCSSKIGKWLFHIFLSSEKEIALHKKLIHLKNAALKYYPMIVICWRFLRDPWWTLTRMTLRVFCRSVVITFLYPFFWREPELILIKGLAFGRRYSQLYVELIEIK